MARIDMHSNYEVFRTKADVRNWIGEGGTVTFSRGDKWHAYRSATLTYSYGTPTLVVRLTADWLDELPDSVITFRGSQFDIAYAVCRAFVGTKEENPSNE